MGVTTEHFEDRTCTPAVSGFLTRPESPNGRGLVLTHGAGSNCDSPLLRAVAETFAEAGYTVLRCYLAFRQQRKPPRSSPEDRESLRNAVLAIRNITSGPVILGGHSYGGRQASMLLAESPEVADALLLLSYPLHPPSKPEQLRTAHLPALRTPSVFVHGTRDPFGTIAELEAALKLITAPTRLLTVERAGHDLKVAKSNQQDFLSALPGVLNEFLPSSLPRC